MPLKRDVSVIPGAIWQVIKYADKHHLTGKPVEVMSHFNRIYQPGELFWSHLWVRFHVRAAQMDGYRWVGCELSEHYYRVARDRLDDINRINLVQ